MGKMISPNLQSRVLYQELRKLSTGTGASDVIDMGHFPQGTLQVYGGTAGDAPGGLTADIYISDMPDGAWVKFADCTQANLGTIVGPAPGGNGGFVLLPIGARFAYVNVTALASGKVGVVVNVPAQS